MLQYYNPENLVLELDSREKVKASLGTPGPDDSADIPSMPVDVNWQTWDKLR